MSTTSAAAMTPLKLFLIFLFITLSAFNMQLSKPVLTQWVITKGCTLKVEGSTNVNKFMCVITDYAKPDTINFNKSSMTGSVKINGSIKLDVQNFDCHNPVMTRDLRKTLKSKTFPKLIIRFVSLSSYPQFNNHTNAITGIVTIELAGVTKRFDVNYRFTSHGPKTLNLVGSRLVNFSDFNIIPPRRLGGMIQTNDLLKVEFNLNMKVID